MHDRNQTLYFAHEITVSWTRKYHKEQTNLFFVGMKRNNRTEVTEKINDGCVEFPSTSDKLTTIQASEKELHRRNKAQKVDKHKVN